MKTSVDLVIYVNKKYNLTDDMFYLCFRDTCKCYSKKYQINLVINYSTGRYRTAVKFLYDHYQFQ